jgi:hypothetical protein
MSDKNKATAKEGKPTPALVPKLRFPEFRAFESSHTKARSHEEEGRSR